MSKKKLQREAAQKKARRMRIAILSGCAVFAVAVVVFVVAFVNSDDPASGDAISDGVISHAPVSDVAVLPVSLDEDGILEISAYDLPMRVQDIHTNQNVYLGMTIRYEGAFLSVDWENETIFFVAQLGGCCGVYGFEVYLNDIEPVDDETLVQVTGVLELVEIEGAERTVLRLDVISLVEV